jgi:hypothetical protein
MVLSVVVDLVLLVVVLGGVHLVWRWVRKNLRAFERDGTAEAYRMGLYDGWWMRERGQGLGMSPDDVLGVGITDANDWRMRENAN